MVSVTLSLFQKRTQLSRSLRRSSLSNIRTGRSNTNVTAFIWEIRNVKRRHHCEMSLRKINPWGRRFSLKNIYFLII